MKAEVSTSSAPMVTIGMPVYNSERFLVQSIESLLSQTYRDFVLVISDNASTDGTAAICERFARADSRVRYHRNPENIGMNPNFNRVFELTQSRYLKWSTDDDYWMPDMLADAVAILESDPSICLAYPWAVLIDGEGRELSRYEDKLHLMQDDPVERFLTVLTEIRLCNHHLGLLRTEVIRKTRLFGNYPGADTGFVAEMSLYGKLYQMPKHQLFRRFHEDSSSWQRGNADHEARRFHAARAGRMPFNAWRVHAGVFGSVLRAPLSPHQRARALGSLMRRLAWDRSALGRELLRDLPLFVRRKLRGQ
jgi:glycosyltransferase involved in cell wall biosynthesis